MSDVTSKADIARYYRPVRFVPIADIGLRLFDHLVGASEQRGRHLDAEHAGGLHVENKLELAGLLDRQVVRLRTLEDATGIEADLPIHVRDIGPVAHQAASIDVVAHGKA